MDTTSALKLDTRQKILTAALSVAAQDGFVRATTDRIARKAKVSEGIIYHYFKSKEALCFEVIKEHAEKFREEISKHISGDLCAKGKLDKLIDFHFHYFTKEGNIFQIIYGRSGESTVMMSHILKVAIVPYAQIISEIIKSGISGGEFKKVDADIAASGLLGMMQHNILRLHFGFGKFSVSDAKNTVKELYFGGLLK